eukprot:5757045-Pyramimonas_sp.AAC.1
MACRLLSALDPHMACPVARSHPVANRRGHVGAANGCGATPTSPASSSAQDWQCTGSPARRNAPGGAA